MVKISRNSMVTRRIAKLREEVNADTQRLRVKTLTRLEDLFDLAQEMARDPNIKGRRHICGLDKNPKLSFGEPRDIDLMHICVPYSKYFTRTMLKYHQKWEPKGTVIHSTVKPGTTKTIHEKLPKGNIVYSPMRGVHARMHQDMKRYTKFYACYPETDEKIFEQCFRDDCHLKIEKYSTPFALELAKILIVDALIRELG